MKRKSTAGEFITGFNGDLCRVKYYHLGSVKSHIGQDPNYSFEGEPEEFGITEVEVEYNKKYISIEDYLLILAEKNYYKEHIRLY